MTITGLHLPYDDRPLTLDETDGISYYPFVQGVYGAGDANYERSLPSPVIAASLASDATS